MHATAWFDASKEVSERHPAQNCSCPTCFAPVNAPCTVTTTMPGTCVSEMMILTGMHAERVELGITRWGSQS